MIDKDVKKEIDESISTGRYAEKNFWFVLWLLS